MSAAAKGWTDTEKLGLIFQIMQKMEKPIPWSELELPEGRTRKACQVMLDKEKAKVREAKKGAADGEEGEGPGTPTPATPATPASKGKKRTAQATYGEDSGKKAKKPRATPKKKKKKVTAGADEDDEKAPSEVEEESSEGADDGAKVKPEPAEEDGELV
ncbi:Hypothetical predicted protein [Lecanosticta acicola]|uniref:Uncharacterized protein n=1 Tax=Lecanosticta acicola TaxID=111012 RepID=A0AAI9EAM3_9PEZI|nr:Hypothetical predicted protein [Lecanosticta acicola]